MKRIALLLAMLMLVALPANAAINWKTEGSLVTISGPAEEGQLVTVIILDDGYDYEDYISSDAAVRNSAIKYFGFDIADENGYEISGIEISESGSYDVYAAGESIIDYVYASITEKIDATKAFNSDASDENVEKLVEAYAFSTDSLVTKNNNYHERVAELEGTLNVDNPDSNILAIKRALILSAYDNGKSEILFDGDDVNYAEELGLDGTPEYEDYLTILNDKGIAAVQTGLLEADYDTIDDIKAEFNELFYVNAIMNNAELGYGHIQKLFENENYKAVYEAAFDEADVDFPPKEDKNLYTALLKSGADTLVEIAKELKPKKDDNKGSIGSLKPSQSFSPSSPSAGTSVPAAKPVDFTDTKAHWASEAIDALAKDGVINGYDDKTFKPENAVTRAEFAKMLVTLLKLDIAETASNFKDVAADDWFAPYVAAAAKAGFIKGADGSFNPNEIISRQDTAVILVRAMGLKSTGTSSFTDSDSIFDYAKEAAAAVEEAGIMTGMEDGSFAPFGSLTRAQAAAVLYRLLQKGV